MVMAVSSNEKEIANTMLKSVVHMAPRMLVGTNRHNSTRKIGIGSIKNEGPQIAAFGFNKRHIPGYIRVAHAAVAFGLQFANLEKQRSKPAKRHADEQHPPF